MRWSNSFIPTLKESPQEAEAASHKLMLRAGLIRRLASGTYSYLPLGFRVLKKIKAIIREEMDGRGAQEVLLPAIQPVELWQQTRRYEDLGEDMIKFIDRHKKEHVLGPTHEEVITALVKGSLASYRNLPQILYQIQTKFRDEPRPRFGVIRSREFIMKDAYSFDRDEAGLDTSFKRMFEAYCEIFKRCGLDFLVVEADPGVMGGSESKEFMVPAQMGEDVVEKDGKTIPCIEVGHIFKLGTKYSKALAVTFLDEDGKEKEIIMGCYGIGVNRIMAAAIEQHNDADGIIWPRNIAPYEVLILPINAAHRDSMEVAERLYCELTDSGVEALLDDRDLRAGVKFKDADLIGIPLRINIGERNLSQGKVEVLLRKDKKALLVNKEEAAQVAQDLLEGL